MYMNILNNTIKAPRSIVTANFKIQICNDFWILLFFYWMLNLEIKSENDLFFFFQFERLIGIMG